MKKQWRLWFPRLKPEDFQITSPLDRAYNCLAYAAGDLGRVWDPAETPAGSKAFYWPSGVSKDHTIGTWQQALASVGFAPVPPAEQQDPGWLRVAIYGQGGKATHAARQLQDGALPTASSNRGPRGQVDLGLVP